MQTAAQLHHWEKPITKDQQFLCLKHLVQPVGSKHRDPGGSVSAKVTAPKRVGFHPQPAGSQSYPQKTLVKNHQENLKTTPKTYEKSWKTTKKH